MLFDVVVKSKISIAHVIQTKEQYDKFKTSFPAMDETFSDFLYFLKNKPTISNDDLPIWPKNSLMDLRDKEGVFISEKSTLISVRNIEKGLFPYAAFYALGSHQSSEYVKDLNGKYITILTQAVDKKHYEPIGFSYLIRDEYFQTKNTKLIFPCLTIPLVIPEELADHWVYLAMRYFNQNLSDTIEYKYLAVEENEINLLKRYDQY